MPSCLFAAPARFQVHQSLFVLGLGELALSRSSGVSVFPHPCTPWKCQRVRSNLLKGFCKIHTNMFMQAPSPRARREQRSDWPRPVMATIESPCNDNVEENAWNFLLMIHNWSPDLTAVVDKRHYSHFTLPRNFCRPTNQRVPILNSALFTVIT